MDGLGRAEGWQAWAGRGTPVDTGLEVDAPLRYSSSSRVYCRAGSATGKATHAWAPGATKDTSDWTAAMRVEDTIGVLATVTRGQDQANWAVQPVPFLVPRGTISPCLVILTPGRPRDLRCRSYRQRTRETRMAISPSLRLVVRMARLVLHRI